MALKSSIKKPWPTKAVMRQIYEKHLWGGSQYDFYSGMGSHNKSLVDPYIHVLRSFLTSFSQPIRVCDLGCGDFNVGRQLHDLTIQYIGVDIVDELITRNELKYASPNLEFDCLDISEDQLPSADCVILRQVLQHLSNAEIMRIAKKLSAYQYVIVTEHMPNGQFNPNLDIVSGQGIRLKKESGVDLLSSPFNLKVKSDEMLLSIDLADGKGRIVTTLYRMSSPSALGGASFT